MVDMDVQANEHLICSENPHHPANLICELCRKFYTLGWVTGTGGGTSIRQDDHIFIAPSGVQKELMQPKDIFVMSYPDRSYLRKPLSLKPSQCTPLFMAAFDRGAGCCIHTHSQWAVLITLLVERGGGKDACFEISNIEQIKGIPRGKGKVGNLGYFDTLRIPIIENTAHEEDLTESLEAAMDKHPDSYAVLVRRHGIYVWGDSVHKAKTQAESLDYLFQLAVEMRKLGLPWLARPPKGPFEILRDSRGFREMGSSDEDEFGELDDNDMLQAATTLEEAGACPHSTGSRSSSRAVKRRRLTRELDLAVSREQRRLSELDSNVLNGGEDFGPAPLPMRGDIKLIQNTLNNSGNLESRPRPKHKVHKPVRTELPKDAFYTQPPLASSSPYRIRGPRWKKQNVSPDPSNDSTVTQLFPIMLEKPGPGDRVPATCLDEGNAFDPSPHPVRRVIRKPNTTGSDIRGSSPLNSISQGPQHNAVSTVSLEDVDICSTRESPVVKGRHAQLISHAEYNQELEGFPSDAFDWSSSPSPQAAGDKVQYVSSQALLMQTQRQRLVGPHAGLRQTTLFGGTVESLTVASQSIKRHNWPLANKDESPTHHTLDREALKTWVYPTNLGTIRDYQFNIVQRGLFHNLLVALPTGLGKTFIAATIMLNWFRWTTEAQIVFVAPTKPLVAQQIEACFGVAGIPRSQTTMLTGTTAPGIRAEEWRSKRVFFMTPQTLINDLKTGCCEPKRIVLVIVDEAHRATGGYAYVEVINFLSRFNTSFRVLALTATPGASVEAVQQVVDGLNIARVEIRTEESIDIREYVHNRKVETVLFDRSDEMVMVMDLFSKALQPILDKVNQQNAYWAKDPMTLTPFGLTEARRKWMGSDAGRNANMGLKGMINTIFTLLASLAHSIELLKYHGIGPFYHNLIGFRNEVQSGEKSSKYRKQINESPHFQQMMTRVQSWINNFEFVGHPKLEYLRNVVLNHFLDAGEGRGVADGAPPSNTRIMIFVHYRDSAEEVVRVLKRNEPMIRPHVFVGQASAKGSEGMDQKKQLEVIQKFKDGIYNTIVATSIGEEGLDIGEVDLIVCYDSSASPIRMLQRMGRTGRKRAGNIVLLLMRGKEENSFIQAKDNYEKMQQIIATGARFNFHDDKSPRIVPRDIQPVVDKKIIEIPIENSQGDLPEPKRRARPPKRPPKKFHMPDGVRTGFVKASRLQDGESNDDSESSEFGNSTPQRARERIGPEARQPLPQPETIPTMDEVLLNMVEEKEMDRRYQHICGRDGIQTVETPSLDAFPAYQRFLGRSRHVRHGRTTRRFVKMLQTMHCMDDEKLDSFRCNLRGEDREAIFPKVVAQSSSGNNENQDTVQSHSVPKKSMKQRAVRSKRLPSTSPSVPDGEMSMSDEDVDTQLGTSLVDDLEDQQETQTSVTTSSLPMHVSTKPFYEFREELMGASNESDEDLPDFSALVQKKTTVAKSDNLEIMSDDSAPASTLHRKGRRMVVEDSSDED
ncbi:MAG: 3'-5' DNA helicase [Pycnora praestabilis]|nr:MAG: 3'-5' DNA helicase [Pycnora praestabilis]